MNDTPIIFVLFGITGDLAQRKLLPALAQIQTHNSLPDQFRVIGVTRQKVNVDELLVSSLGSSSASAAATIALRSKIEILQMNSAVVEEFKILEKQIRKIERQWGKCQIIYYISVPPQISFPIITGLGSSRLAKRKDSKLLLEKPFGTDLTSATELVSKIHTYFSEDQIYRIDHYLAKEMAQNIIFFREGNAIFRHVWNNQAIEKIDIMASEAIGIEGRTVFYEQTGALRDVLQSHLMQLLAITLADIPSPNSDKAIQRARLEALESLSPADPAKAIRGQYVGYADEVDNTGTLTETFASITLFSEDPKWQGVPIRVMTGKALDQKLTEIKIYFKPVGASQPNILTLRIQPSEGVELDLWAKEPGYERKAQLASLNFDYGKPDSQLPDAYEQVLLDALRSDKTLFATSDEIIAAWRVLEPLQKHWSMHDDDLILYPRGSSPDQIK